MSTEKPTVLILDDEEIIRIALKETLSSQGYRLIVTGSAREALDVLKENQVSVILSDQRMPEMMGLDFLSEAKKIQPHATRILITGVVNLSVVMDAVNKGEIFRFLAKPWIREDLLITIKNGVQRYQMLQANAALQGNLLALNEKITNTYGHLEKENIRLKSYQRELELDNQSLRENIQESLDYSLIMLFSQQPHLKENVERACSMGQRIVGLNVLSKDEQQLLFASIKVYYLKQYTSLAASFSGLLRKVNDIIRNQSISYSSQGSVFKVSSLVGVILFYANSQQSREITVENILKKSGTVFEPAAVRLFLKATRMVKIHHSKQEIDLKDLSTGMVLATDICTPSGERILEEGLVLNSASIRQLKHHHQVFTPGDKVTIYK